MNNKGSINIAGSSMVFLIALLVFLVVYAIVINEPSDENKGVKWDEEPYKVEVKITAIPSEVTIKYGDILIIPEGKGESKIKLGVEYTIGGQLFLDTARLNYSELAYIFNNSPSKSFTMNGKISWQGNESDGTLTGYFLQRSLGSLSLTRERTKALISALRGEVVDTTKPSPIGGVIQGGLE